MSAKYQLPETISQKSQIQIDGSKSLSAKTLGGDLFNTFITVSKPYPKSCEEYFFGRFYVKGDQNSEAYPLPSGQLIRVNYTRQFSRSSVQMSGQVRETHNTFKDLFFFPRPGKKYIFRIHESKKAKKPFLEIIEMTGKKETPFTRAQKSPFDHCERVKVIKQYR